MSVPSLTHRASLVARRFIVESRLLATISTDVFKAIGKDQPVPVVIVFLRGGLSADSPDAPAFAQRIRNLQNAKLLTCSEVGVDDENNAFIVMPQLEGASISAGRIEKSEAERRFLSAARLMARVHELGMCCGDITPHSFWVTRSGEVSLLTPCGVPFGALEPPGAHWPKADEDAAWREFLAPEVLAGQLPTASSDVFSIACLGRRLLAAFLSTDKGAYLAPIFAAALSPDPLLRPTSAGMLLEQILLARSESVAALATRKTGGLSAVPGAAKPTQSGGAGATREVHVGKSLQNNSVALSEGSVPSKGGDSSDAARMQTVPSSRSRPVIVGVLGILVVVSFFVGTNLASRHQQHTTVDSGRQAQLEMVAGNASLEQAVKVLNNPDSTVAEREVELGKLTNSDDPLAHEFLVRAALGASSDQDRLLAERAVVERARRLSMLRSAEQGRIWLRGMQENALPAAYEPVLRLMNANLPEQARLSFLKQILAHDPELAVRLAAAGALDLDTAPLTELLAQLISERTARKDTVGKSLLALLLADPELAALYGDDVIQRRDQLTLVDLNWILPILADRNDLAIRPIANLALEKSAVSPVKAVFLELIRDRSELAPEVLATLVRASTDTATEQDIAVLGRWIDIGAERALLALCATVPSGDPRALEAFDTMAGRSGSVEPSASMVEWLRTNRWSDRERYIQVVGAMSFADRLTRAEIEAMLPKYDAVLRQSGMLEVLVRHSSPVVSGLLVQRFGNKLGMGGLVNLLDHPEKTVRLAAIKGLSAVNEASVLRLILDKYHLEKDQDVRKAYFDSFWVVRERGGK